MNVSVIIPVFNAEAFLKRSIESVLSQPQVVQLLLIDDGSIDMSLSICKQYLFDERVVILQHPNKDNRGVSSTRNLGIENANADYIAFLDADDYYLPNRFITTEKIFNENKDCDAVYECLGIEYSNSEAKSNYKRLGKTLENTTVRKPYLPSKFFTALVSNENVSFDAITIKRDCLNDEFRFNKDMKQAEDTDLLWRLANRYNFYAGEIHEPVAVRVIHDSNSILNLEESSAYKSMHLKKWFQKIPTNNWSGKANFYLTARYAHTLSRNKVGWIINFLFIVIKNPRLLLKFFNN